MMSEQSQNPREPENQPGAETLKSTQKPETSIAKDPSGKDASTENPQPREIGGRDGLDPTRYGDWEKNGRCIDF